MTNKSSQKDDQWDRIAEGIFNALFQLSKIFVTGVGDFFRWIRCHYLEFLLLAGSFNFFLIQVEWHLEVIYSLLPNSFGLKIIQLIAGASSSEHFLRLMLLEVMCLCFILGVKVISTRKKWENFFEATGLKNGRGTYPAFIKSVSLDNYRTSHLFVGNGVGIDQFRSKDSSLETMLGVEIESIDYGSSPKIVKITTNSKKLPTFLSFEDSKEKLSLNQNEFILGDTKEGLKKVNFKSLPHLLIAGTTGGGKSVFFKQTLTGLLCSTNHLQMYLIDLKGGLEFSDFKNFPNVKIIKNIDEAATLLQKIDNEMMKRFDLLENKNKKEIDPERDKRDRIIVAVDEASVLYANKDKYSEDHESSVMARNFTDRIAKLGRAAGIHLILATQKVSKETVSTSIQENISARMCFRMNTLQGSLALLGDKRAMELPAISGRGIWSHGSDSFEVQVPFIDDYLINQKAKLIKDDYQFKDKENFSALIGKDYDHPSTKKLQSIIEAGKSFE